MPSTSTASVPIVEGQPGVGAPVLDLFAGAGGLTEGFDQAGGFRTVRAVEFDVAAAATYAANHGDVVDVVPIEQWLRDTTVPSADVVVGGPPCQGFSQLGKQDIEDARNRLWEDYVEVVRRAHPHVFVLENVGAFRRSPQYAALLASTGPGAPLADYEIRTEVLNAADYGAPQARRRTIAIGCHKDLSHPGLPVASHSGAHPTVRQVLREVPVHVEGISLPNRRTRFDGRDLPGSFATFELHVGRTYTALSLERFRHIPEGGNRFDLPDDLKAPCWRRHLRGSGDVMGRLWWDRPSVTVRTEFGKPEKGRYLHPVEDRVITHREAALLQGFPDDYRWVGSKTDIARQIGNAVPIPLAQAVASHLRDALAL